MLFNHDQLQFQHQWAGPKLQNLRLLVCRSCLDVPQEGLRTIILPPDPVPIQNPRPEQYVSDNNPNSGIGQAPLPALAGTNIGTLINGGGTWAAFDGNETKRFFLSANLPISVTGYNNWVGKNWNVTPPAPTDTSIKTNTLRYIASGFEAIAPSDAPFLASPGDFYTTEAGSPLTTESGLLLEPENATSAGVTGYRFEASQDGSAWTVLASGTTTGALGETISTLLGGGTAYQFYRFNLNGDGISAVAVAQLKINTDRGNFGIVY